MSARDLIFEIFAIDRASATFSKVGTEAEAMGSKAEKGAAMASKAFLGAGVVMAALGIKSVQMAAQFESSTQRFTTTAGESAKGLDMVRKGILEMAGQVGESSNTLAQAMYYVESGGFHGARGLEVLKTAAQGAAVEGSDVTEVAHALAGALNDYHGTTLNAVTATNAMTAAVGSGMMTFNDLAEALPKIGTRAAAAHVRFSEMLAALGTMTKDGLPAAVAATYLGQSIGQLAAPTSKATTEMHDLGLKASDVSAAITSGSGHGLADAIKMLWDASSRAGKIGQTQVQALANMAGGVKAYQGVLMLGGPHVDQYASSLAAINKQIADGGTAVEGFAKQQTTTTQKMKDAEGAASALAIEIGNHLKPEADAALQGFASFATFLGEHQTLLTNTVLAIGGASAAFGVYKLAVGGAAFVTNTLIGADAMLGIQMAAGAVAAGDFSLAMEALNLALDANPIGLAVTAVAAVGAALWGGKAAMDAFGHSTHDSTIAIGDYSNAIDKATGKITRLTRAQALNVAQQALGKPGANKLSVFQEGSLLGLNQNVLTHAAIGDQAALGAVQQQLALEQAKYASQLAKAKAAKNPVGIGLAQGDLDMIKNVTAALHAQSGAIADATKKERDQNFATLDAQKSLKGLSKATADAILHNNAMANTAGDVAKLATQYHLLPKEIRTVIKAEQVPTTVSAVEQIIKSMGKVNTTKADLTPFQRSVSSQVGAVATPAQRAALLVGQDMLAGITAGFSPAAAQLAAEASAAVTKAIAAARAAGQTHSPSRKFMAVGADMGDGLVIGLASRKAAAQTAGSGLVSAVAKGIHAKRSAIQAEVNALGNDLTKIGGKIQSAQSFSDSWMGNIFAGAMQSLASSASSPSGSPSGNVFSMSSIGTNATAAQKSPLQALMDFATQQETSATTLGVDVAKLLKEGAGSVLIAQLQSAGPDALPMIDALANGPASNVATLNSLLGSASTNTLNAGAQLNGASSFKVLQSQQKTEQRLENALQRVLHDKSQKISTTDQGAHDQRAQLHREEMAQIKALTAAVIKLQQQAQTAPAKTGQAVAKAQDHQAKRAKNK